MLRFSIYVKKFIVGFYRFFDVWLYVACVEVTHLHMTEFTPTLHRMCNTSDGIVVSYILSIYSMLQLVMHSLYRRVSNYVMHTAGMRRWRDESRKNLCVCVWEGACVCVCVWEVVCVCMWESVRVCIYYNIAWLCVCVCGCGCVWESVCVCVCVIEDAWQWY